jgi:deoxyribodipyrimidine photo-lyase
MNKSPVIVWFRNDLRLTDNFALEAATVSQKPIICVYIFEETPGLKPRGGAQHWWLHHTLTSLNRSLNELGSRLVLRRGNAYEQLSTLINETGGSSVFWNRRYDPQTIVIDTKIKQDLLKKGVEVKSFDGQLLHEPTVIKTGSGTPFKVYTPFWRAFKTTAEPRDPIAKPLNLLDGSGSLKSDLLDDWALLPQKPNWAKGFEPEWQPGEMGAHKRLDEFVKKGLNGYGEGRNLPSQAFTSKLSPHLVFGEISPFQIWYHIKQARNIPPRDMEVFQKEVVWREFAYHLLFHFPKLQTDNFNASFDAFEWPATDPNHLISWQKGQTGYPIVDAGMRQLWQTGWMHNRVRMITASFLIKHLMIDWRMGEQWFWDTLLDACPANNPAGWQWVAGSGADASPYYRIFNPIIQGEKFDANGDYVRRFVPELKDMPDKFIHKPWEAPLLVLKAAGVTFGKTYPMPIIDHAIGRDRAMNAFKTMRGAE